MDFEFEDKLHTVTPVVTKTAIEWEDERCGEDDLNASKEIQPILCFDAYGNLISKKPEYRDTGLTSHLNSFNNYPDIPLNFQLSSSGDDDTDDLDFPNRFVGATAKVKPTPKPKKKARLSDSQLQQIITEEVDLKTTSRYGRERKKRTSDGFLFGTINFNKLHKVTNCSTTVINSKKDKPGLNLNFPSVNFNKGLSSTVTSLSAPGDYPPEKILASSCESSSEAEDGDARLPGPGSRVEEAAAPCNTQDDTLHADSPGHKPRRSPKKTRKRKAPGITKVDSPIAENKNDSWFSDADKSVDDEDCSGSNFETVSPDAKKKKLTEKLLEKLSKRKEKETEEKVVLQQADREKRANRRKRMSSQTSDDDLEVSFSTPRKKKRKPLNNCLISLPKLTDEALLMSSHDYFKSNTGPLKDEEPSNTILKDEFKDSNEENKSSETLQTLRKSINLGVVGDIADDVRLLKDLTAKCASELESTIGSSVATKEDANSDNKVAPVAGSNSVPSLDIRRGRGRPKKHSLAVMSTHSPHKSPSDKKKTEAISQEKATIPSPNEKRTRSRSYEKKTRSDSQENQPKVISEGDDVVSTVCSDSNLLIASLTDTAPSNAPPSNVAMKAKHANKDPTSQTSHSESLEHGLTTNGNTSKDTEEPHMNHEHELKNTEGSVTSAEDCSMSLEDRLANLDDSIVSPATTKRGRQVRKPTIMDISELHQKQLLAQFKKKKEESYISMEKTAPSQQFMEECEAREPPVWQEGELMWVTLKGNPMWPAIILKHAPSGHFTKFEVTTTVKSTRGRRVYHVQFLNDCALTLWARTDSLKSFEGMDRLREHLHHTKDTFRGLDARLRSIAVLQLRTLPHLERSGAAARGTKTNRWWDAVAEAEAIAHETREERIQKYTKCESENDSLYLGEELKPKKKKKKKKKQKHDHKSVSDSLLLTDDEGDKNKDRIVVLRSRSPSNESDFSGFEVGSSGDAQKKHLLEALKNLSKEDAFELFFKIKSKGHKLLNPKDNNEVMREVLLRTWSRLGDKKRKAFCERHLDSFDESDDTFKNKSSSTEDGAELSGSCGKKEVAAPARSTFRLPRHEKVCGKCEGISTETSATDMLRCHGPCWGLFHLRCLGVEVKPINEKDFRCDECVSGVHPCFICKKVSTIVVVNGKKSKSVKTDKESNKQNISKIETKKESICTENKLKTSDTTEGEQSESSKDNVEASSKAGEKIDNKSEKSEEGVSSGEVKVDVKEGDVKVDLKDNVEETNLKGVMKVEDIKSDTKGEVKVGETETVAEVVKCSIAYCGKFYHLSCVLQWPQVSQLWHEGKKLVCPRHVCHMCAANADDMNSAIARSGSFTRCLRCPTTHHIGGDCITAGSEEMSSTNHVCPRHVSQQAKNHINVNWCFGCSKGGSLVLCDVCPAAYHMECLDAPPLDDSDGGGGAGFVCEDCVNGKTPVYGDVVWVKLGIYRWWPGQVLHPRFIPDNIENLRHTTGMFCVHFFGSNDYYWVHRGRVFHYQEGDKGGKITQKTYLNQQFFLALEQAKAAFEEEQTNKSLRDARRYESCSNKPPPFVRIDTNRPVGNVKRQELELPPKCDCDPSAETPCGSNTNCINRMLLIECASEVCGAGESCCNQRFQRRQYPTIIPSKAEGRGWGLKAVQDIRAGEFVVEYVGELVDEAELWRRIDYMHQINEENYYFLTITRDIIIDAGPKGNLARFMNHSCEPNCETQKWQVGTETRVGLFALEDIAAGDEVTFNYNFECVGTEKKKCHCGSTNCSGYIGAKVQKIEIKKFPMKKKRKKKLVPVKTTEDDCFRCGTPGDLILCDIASCPKGYHLSCLGLEQLPKGKWLCPWHHCDECGTRAHSKCELCPNSFCRHHCTGNISYTSTTGPGHGVQVPAGLSYCNDHTQEDFAHCFPNTAHTVQAGADGESESGESVNSVISGRSTSVSTSVSTGTSSSRSSSRCASPPTTSTLGNARKKKC